jgi:hypothetical protein
MTPASETEIRPFDGNQRLAIKNGVEGSTSLN